MLCPKKRYFIEAENEDPAIELPLHLHQLKNWEVEDMTRKWKELRVQSERADDVRQNARMNIYAPRLEQTELTAPNALPITWLQADSPRVTRRK